MAFTGVEVRTGRRVAIKRMVRHHESEGFPKTELREISILRSLSHPHMVNLREVVTSLGCHDVPPAPSVSAPGTPDAAAAPAHNVFDRTGDIYMVFDYVEYDLAGLLESGYRYVIVTAAASSALHVLKQQRTPQTQPHCCSLDTHAHAVLSAHIACACVRAVKAMLSLRHSC
ncbi:hypothetical protein EON66_06210 [archaeon]|nr:MAG: hypothetical protein EON66_06210 [archaeon]